MMFSQNPFLKINLILFRNTYVVSQNFPSLFSQEILSQGFLKAQSLHKYKTDKKGESRKIYFFEKIEEKQAFFDSY